MGPGDAFQDIVGIPAAQAAEAQTADTPVAERAPTPADLVLGGAAQPDLPPQKAMPISNNSNVPSPSTSPTPAPPPPSSPTPPPAPPAPGVSQFDKPGVYMGNPALRDQMTVMALRNLQAAGQGPSAWDNLQAGLSSYGRGALGGAAYDESMKSIQDTRINRAKAFGELLNQQQIQNLGQREAGISENKNYAQNVQYLMTQGSEAAKFINEQTMTIVTTQGKAAGQKFVDGMRAAGADPAGNPLMARQIANSVVGNMIKNGDINLSPESQQKLAGAGLDVAKTGAVPSEIARNYAGAGKDNQETTNLKAPRTGPDVLGKPTINQGSTNYTVPESGSNIGQPVPTFGGAPQRPTGVPLSGGAGNAPPQSAVPAVPAPVSTAALGQFNPNAPIGVATGKPALGPAGQVMVPFSGNDEFSKTNRAQIDDIRGMTPEARKNNFVINRVQEILKGTGSYNEQVLTIAKNLATVNPAFAQFAGVKPDNLVKIQEAEGMIAQEFKSIFANTKNLRSTREFNALAAQFPQMITQPEAREHLMALLRGENNSNITMGRDINYAAKQGFFQNGVFHDVNDFVQHWSNTHDALGRPEIRSDADYEAMKRNGMLQSGEDYIDLRSGTPKNRSVK